MSHIPENLRRVEFEPEINLQSRVVKRAPNRHAVNQALHEVISEGSPLLEIGSGTGELYRLLDEQYLSAGYTGIDNNTEYIAFNRADNPDADLIEGDICELPFDDNSKTSILALNVLDLVAGPDRAINEVIRVLQPGGVFIHFHDRRPNLGYLLRHVPADAEAFPYINQDGLFDRFRLVAKEKTEAQGDRMVRASHNWVSHTHGDPSQLEVLAYAYPSVVAAIASDIEYIFGKVDPTDSSVTPNFKAFFTQIVTQALEASGMRVMIAEDRLAEARVPRREVDSLIDRTPLKAPYQSGDTFIVDQNAHYHSEIRPRNLSQGWTLVRTYMNVIAASKL